MWLSGRSVTRDEREGQALVGTVTLEGALAGAYADGERRNLPVFGPGGLRWRPGMGQEVLVLKAGEAGEVGCIAGVRVDSGDLAPGEVALVAADGQAAVTLGPGGTVDMRGDVWINGKTLEEVVRELTGRGDEASWSY